MKYPALILAYRNVKYFEFLFRFAMALPSRVAGAAQPA